MAKYVKLIFGVCVLSLMICGCSVTHLETSDNMNASIYYDVYELSTAESVFNVAMQNNPIDIAYEKELLSSLDALEIENKYLRIWLEEMECSAKIYKDCLDENDAESFDAVQNSFKKYIEESFAFDAHVIKQETYSIRMGSASSQLLVSQKRQAVRERTIHIKYLHYLFECANEEAFSALSFNTQRQGETGDGSVC